MNKILFFINRVHNNQKYKERNYATYHKNKNCRSKDETSIRDGYKVLDKDIIDTKRAYAIEH